MIRESGAGHLFRDIGMASIRFAQAYSVIFQDLIMKHNYDAVVYNACCSDWTFSCGGNGILPSAVKDNEAEIMSLMDAVAIDLLIAARWRVAEMHHEAPVSII